jgi:hypothetical protein
MEQKEEKTMKRKMTLVLLAILVGFGLTSSIRSNEARFLIAVPGVDDAGLQTLIEEGYRVVVHCNDFALVLGDAGTVPILEKRYPGVSTATEWKKDVRYFLIQAIRPDAAKRTVAGEILYHREGMVVYRGSLEEALRLREGHASIIPVTENTIRPIQPEPIEIALDSGDRDLIQEMVDAINQSGIVSYVTQLSSLDRFTWSQDCFIAGEGIKNAFESWGYTAVREQSYDPDWAPNVIAIKPGLVYPDEYVLIGGHYDSYSFFGPSAPGADDNASGSATVLEAARVMAGYQFERSLAFVTFSGEEMGLVGSDALASFAVSRGIDIRAVINVDMDGYVEPGQIGDLDVIANNPSLWIYDIVQSAADTYVPDLETVHQSGFAMGGSDHQSFWDHGYEAVWFFEDVEDYSPYIHSSDDIVGLSYNDPEFATNCTRVAVASLALLANPIE